MQLTWVQTQHTVGWQDLTWETLALFVEHSPQLIAVGLPQVTIRSGRTPQTKINGSVVHER